MWRFLLVEDCAYERWVRLLHELDRRVRLERKGGKVRRARKKCQSLLVWFFSGGWP
jgi:hypothetical protein